MENHKIPRDTSDVHLPDRICQRALRVQGTESCDAVERQDHSSADLWLLNLSDIRLERFSDTCTATPDIIHQAGFCLDVTAKVLPLYETIFDIEYPLPKLDTLAVSHHLDFFELLADVAQRGERL